MMLCSAEADVSTCEMLDICIWNKFLNNFKVLKDRQPFSKMIKQSKGDQSLDPSKVDLNFFDRISK